MPSSWRQDQGDLPQAQSLYEGNRTAEFTASNLLMDGYFPILVHIDSYSISQIISVEFVQKWTTTQFD